MNKPLPADAPVAWLECTKAGNRLGVSFERDMTSPYLWQPLYAHPPVQPAEPIVGEPFETLMEMADEYANQSRRQQVGLPSSKRAALYDALATALAHPPVATPAVDVPADVESVIHALTEAIRISGERSVYFAAVDAIAMLRSMAKRIAELEGK